jgi:hypothetical protein
MGNKVPMSQIRGNVDALLNEYWSNHYINDTLHLCSLCGNTGIIDTRNTAISPAGFDAGRLNYCICPNGRIMRENKTPLHRR